MSNDTITARPRDPAPTPQEVTAKFDGAVAAGIDQTDSLTRALVAVLVAELNRHSTIEAGILTAVANATSLADLKTQMATVSGLPQRSLADLRTAIRNALGS